MPVVSVLPVKRLNNGTPDIHFSYPVVSKKEWYTTKVY
jgi:hypothetical protein